MSIEQECPFRVKSRHFALRNRHAPCFAPKSGHQCGANAECLLCANKRTHVLRQSALLLDHLVGAPLEYQTARHSPSAFSGLQIDDRSRTWSATCTGRVGGFLALEDAIDITRPRGGTPRWYSADKRLGRHQWRSSDRG